MAKEKSLVLSLETGTGAHRAFFAMRPADKCAGYEAERHPVYIATGRLGRSYRPSCTYCCGM